jgi:hypothetical protein
MKFCSFCEKQKETKFFGMKANGRQNICFECINKRNRELERVRKRELDKLKQAHASRCFGTE